MTQILPGIIKVGYVLCSFLTPNIPLKARAGVPVSVLSGIHWLDIQSDATCQSVGEYDNHGEVETTTLQFHTTDEIPTRLRLAFLIVTVDGSAWLVGAAEPPYPTIEITRHTGESGGQRAGNTVKVSLKSLKSLVSIGK